MTIVHRVLDPAPVPDLDAYVGAGGGDGLRAARALDPADAVELVVAAGIRGRGGAGFPTGIKWRTVAANRSELVATSVVVNAAEGEPGSFKDREILRRNPYRVIEGALIAAHALGADAVIIGMKRTSTRELDRVRAALAEVEDAGWAAGIALQTFAGPAEYLLGEETALLEAIDGRPPFPRVAPPYRRGVDEMLEHSDDVEAESGLSAHVEMAGADSDLDAPPTLVDNVETLAHVTLAFAHGVDWFRSIGTEESPGSVVCTVSGDTQRSAVGEVAMGTPLGTVIDEIGGGMRSGRRVEAVLQGVASAVITAAHLDAPVSWEGLAAIGSGLGAAAFMVHDDGCDPVAIAAGVTRFLAVESCGQCTPCKQDGLAMRVSLDRLLGADGSIYDLERVRTRLETVADGARCSLATQQQVVVGSIVDTYGAAFDAHVNHELPHTTAAPIVPMLALDDGVVVLDEEQTRKQPDWTFNAHDSGQSPADRLDDHRMHEEL